MSEEFDKEAERERLREKYESESTDREITERMSQLLLQGATMTNTHCDTCGSPIFRYQGQEFCPVCQAEGTADDTAAQAGAAGEQAADAGQGATGGEQTASDAGQTVPEGGQQAPDAGQQAPAAGQSAAAAQPGSQPDQPSADAQTPTAPESVGAASTGTAELGGGTRATGQAGTDVGESLSRTIATLSERAREAEDPRQAKALLEAAHEAAKTLVTLSE